MVVVATFSSSSSKQIFRVWRISSGIFPLVVRFWMNRLMDMAGAIVGIVDEEGVVVSAFLTIWG